MAKLPFKKAGRGPVATRLPASKSNKTFKKKNIKNNVSSGSSPKPSNATNSKQTAQSPKPIKNNSKQTAQSPKPIKNNTKQTAQSPKPIKNNSKQTDQSPKPIKNNTKQTDQSPKPTKIVNSKPKGTQMEKKNNKNFNPAKAQKQKKKRGKRGRSKPKLVVPKRSLVLQPPRLNDRLLDRKLMKKYGGNAKVTVKGKKKDSTEDVDAEQLINLDVLKAAITGLRKFPRAEEGKKSLHDITDGDERFVYLQVCLCKLRKVTDDFHLHGPNAVSVYLPHSLVTDSTDVVLITKDLQRGIRRDHQNSLDHFKEHLHAHGAASLVNEVIPLRQLKVEHKEFEAKRILASRVDVLLCDDTVIRFIPKFLGKHFYIKNKLPVQVNLKAKNLQKELLRALSISKLFCSMRGNSAIMKVGRMGQTDEEIQENVLAAVKKLSRCVPGKWVNVQGLNVKLENSTAIPLYVKMDSLNAVKPVPVPPLYPRKPVSGTLSTQPGKCITVFPDGTVTANKINTKNRDRLQEEKEEQMVTTEDTTKKTKKGKKGAKEKSASEESTAAELPDATTEEKETKEKNNNKRKATEKKSNKTKKQKKDRDADSDSDSEEEQLEEQEMMYLKQLTQRKQEETTDNQEEDEESDIWGDSESDMEQSD